MIYLANRLIFVGVASVIAGAMSGCGGGSASETSADRIQYAQIKSAGKG